MTTRRELRRLSSISASDDGPDAVARAQSALEHAARCSEQVGTLTDQLSGELEDWTRSLRQVCSRPRISESDWAGEMHAAQQHRAALGELHMLLSESIRAITGASTCLVSIDQTRAACPDTADTVATLSVAVIRLDAVLRFAGPVIDGISRSLVEVKHACAGQDSVRVEGFISVLDEHSRDLAALARILDVTVRPPRGARRRSGTTLVPQECRGAFNAQSDAGTPPELRRKQRSKP